MSSTEAASVNEAALTAMIAAPARVAMGLVFILMRLSY
jgi:hypothetical protein